MNWSKSKNALTIFNTQMAFDLIANSYSQMIII